MHKRYLYLSGRLKAPEKQLSEENKIKQSQSFHRNRMSPNAKFIKGSG